jgi:hypothetical protein
MRHVLPVFPSAAERTETFATTAAAFRKRLFACR